MRLRNRTIGPAFYLFEQLPTEIRHMIWRFSLEPRLVELSCVSTYAEDSQEGGSVNREPDESSPEAVARASLRRDRMEAARLRVKATRVRARRPWLTPREDFQEWWEKCLIRYRTKCRISLPAALSTCHDSRNAVLPLYPLCFASETHPPSTRFNLSLDTLYLSNELVHGSGNTAHKLLNSLSHTETAQLANLALFDSLDNAQGEDFWTKLGAQVDKLVGLKRTLLVRDVCTPLIESCYEGDDAEEEEEEEEELENMFYFIQKRCCAPHSTITLTAEYPQELLQHLPLEIGDQCVNTEKAYRYISQKWIAEKTESV